MNDKIPNLSRRNAIKALGGAAAVGTAGIALSGSGAAALSSTFDASPVTITNDTGDVDSVYLAPRSKVEWDNFDVPITKVRQTVFARLAQSGSIETPTPDPNPVPDENGWWPIYRNTPWLFTTGVSDGEAQFQYNGDNAAYSSDQPWPLHKLTVGGEEHAGTSGVLDYEMNNGENVLVAEEDTPRPSDYDNATLTGTSVGQAPARVNGAYGTVSDTALFDNADDGSTLQTTVDLGLLTTLHTDYDFAENVPTPEKTNPDSYSPLAMGNSPDVGYQFGDDTHAIPYAELYKHAGSHPAVGWSEAAFTVTAENEPSENGSQTTANTGGT